MATVKWSEYQNEIPKLCSDGRGNFWVELRGERIYNLAPSSIAIEASLDSIVMCHVMFACGKP